MITMQDFNPNNCPIGLVHDKEIEHTKDILNMAIQRLEEHIDTVKKDVNEGFANVNTHFEAVDKRFDDLERQFNNLKEDIPGQIDERIKENNGAKALNILKWVIISLGGSVVIAIFTRLALQVFGLV